MTKAQVWKAATTKWGKSAAIRFNRRAARRTERDEASAQLRAHRANKPSPMTREWRERERQLIGIAVSRPYSIGHLDDYFGAFCIAGEGDSWQEAAEKAGLVKH